jgi:hypothetical protein
MIRSDPWYFGSRGTYACLQLAVIVLAGCGHSGVGFPRTGSGASAEEKSNDVNLGVISGDISHEFVIGGQSMKQVEDVGKSCGCTAVGVAKGDLLDLSLPFSVRVDVAGKVQGPQSQSFRIVFTDGTAYSGKLLFDYWPPPHVNPMYLVFRAGENEKDLRLSFPREEAVAVDLLGSPSHLTWELLASQDIGSGELAVRVRIDRTALERSEEGVITIHTTSPRLETVKVPYLVLVN